MRLIPYLNFAGNCRDAFAFYATALGAAPASPMTYGESPMAAEMPADSHHLVMHMQLDLGGGTLLMGADGPPPHDSGPVGHDVMINLMVDSAADAERTFAALSGGATISMPLQQTFWAERFGMLTDRFGKAWMVNYTANPDCS